MPDSAALTEMRPRKERIESASSEKVKPRGRDARDARPKVAVDIALFAVRERRLECYLVELRRGPAAGKWAFPGRLVRVGEVLDEAASDELDASTGLRATYLEQLRTFGEPTRDPNAHVVSVGYLALNGDCSSPTFCQHKYSSGRWFDVGALPSLAYDHTLMAAYALDRLKAKLEYTNIACNLLPASFTFAELEDVYATVLKRELDRRNFRRRILAMGLLRRLPRMRRGSHRPAALYEFARRDLQIIEML